MLLWLTASAFAWDVEGTDWSYQQAPVREKFELNADSFGDVASADDVEAVFQRAIDTWNAESGADLYVEYGGRTKVTKQGGGDDDHDVGVFGDGTYGAGLAVSTYNSDADGMTDCDTAYHAWNAYGTIDWHVGEDAAPAGEFDLQNTMTHELGHCLGLAHSDDEASIMYAYNDDGTGEEKRHLTDDDREGIQYLYGAVAPDVSYEIVVEPAGDSRDVSLTFTNSGDGSAFFLSGSLTFAGGDPHPFEVGNVGADTPVGRRVGPSVVQSTTVTASCDEIGGGDVFVELSDRLGMLSAEDTYVDFGCVNAPRDTGGGSEDVARACGCDASSTPGGGFTLLLAAAVLAFRRADGGRRRADS